MRKAVASIYNQTKKPFEIIIIDQSEKKHTSKQVLEKYWGCPDIRVVILHRPNISGLTAAKNLGLKYANGDIIQFLDDDSEVEKSFISCLNKCFVREEIDGAAGKIIEMKKRIHPLAKYFQKIFYLGQFRLIREEWYHENRPKEKLTNSLPGVAAYRKEIFKRYLFDEKLNGACIGEDLDFSFRASKEHKFILTSKLRSYHNPDPSERLNSENQSYQKIRFFQYHFKKNIDPTSLNKALYIWLNIGFLMHYIISWQPRKAAGFFRAWLEK